MTPLRKRMLEDLQIRNYAPTTIAAYIRGVAGFAKHFGKPPDQLGPEHIRQYQLFLSQQKRASLSTYIQVVAGPRSFCAHTLYRQSCHRTHPSPRYEKKLPIILSQPEAKALPERRNPRPARRLSPWGTPSLGLTQPIGSIQNNLRCTVAVSSSASQSLMPLSLSPPSHAPRPLNWYFQTFSAAEASFHMEPEL